MEEQFLDAIFEEDLPTMRQILQQPVGGFNVNAAGQDGTTVLHFTVIHDLGVAIIQAILQADGVNANARTATGCTPLHFFYRLSSANQVPIIQAMLDAGADPNVADADGDSPLFFASLSNSHIRSVQALLDGGANPATRNNNLDTPLHTACSRGRVDVAQLLIQRQGSACLTLKNDREETPLDCLAQDRYSIPGGVKAPIRQHILQPYAGMMAQRDGVLCLHSVLQDATFIEGTDDQFHLLVGKLNTEYLQILLECIIAAEPGSVRALDIDGLLPLQVARQLNFPDLVLNVLLRPYPEALLIL